MSVTPALLIAGLIAALHYAIHHINGPVGLSRTVTKTIPLICLTLFAAFTSAPPLIIAALAFSTIGDAALSRDGDRWFVTGLIAFLLAHVAFIALFWPLFDVAHLTGGRNPLWLLFACAPAWGCILFYRLWGRLGALRFPTMLYAVVIAAMTMLATGLGRPFASATIGAVLFAVSDSLLAIEKFGSKQSPAIAQLIWWPYIIGQSLILAAFI